MFLGRTELKIVVSNFAFFDIFSYYIAINLEKLYILSKQLKELERQMKYALEHDKNLDRGKWKNLDVSTWRIIEKIQEPMQKDG
jgi:hypothetical protein